MNVVHVAPTAPYNEGWGYQENLLPKYQAKLGHKVSIIVTNVENVFGELKEVDTADYFREDGVRVIRLKRKSVVNEIITNIRAELDIYDYLKILKPDLVFFHGLFSASIYDVVKYKKEYNRNLIIVCDSHSDENNYPYKKGLKRLIFKLIYKFRYKRVNKHVSKVYGVTPRRKDFVESYLGVPKSKTDVLIMGADDFAMNLTNREQLRESVRLKYKIDNGEFLVVTGGKLTKDKNVLNLIKAVKDLPLKLLIFGSVEKDIKMEFDALLSQTNNVIYVGWASSTQVYEYFYAGDLLVFPGLHSVLWEQACASKTPCLFNDLAGMEHLDVGGNSKFVNGNEVNFIKDTISALIFTPTYYQMQKVAFSDKTDVYFYSKIAEKSLECLSK